MASNRGRKRSAPSTRGSATAASSPKRTRGRPPATEQPVDSQTRQRNAARRRRTTRTTPTEPAAPSNGALDGIAETTTPPPPPAISPPTTGRSTADERSSSTRRESQQFVDLSQVSGIDSLGDARGGYITAAFAGELVRAIRNSMNESGFRAGGSYKSRKLPEFSGDPLEFRHFRESYFDSAGDFTARCNIDRLLEAIKGEAKGKIRTMVATVSRPEKILETLEVYYGNQNIVTRELIRELRALPSLESGQMGMLQFADKLHGSVDAIKELGRRSLLEDVDLFACVLQKIPFSMRVAYSRHSVRYGQEKTPLEKLAEYMHEEAVLAVASGVADVEDVPRVSPAGSSGPARATGRGAAVVCTVVSAAEKARGARGADECALCNRGEHDLGACPKFKGDVVVSRWAVVKRMRRCFGCLGGGHTRVQCSRGVTCEACGGPHHSLLHRGQRGRGTGGGDGPSGKESVVCINLEES